MKIENTGVGRHHLGPVKTENTTTKFFFSQPACFQVSLLVAMSLKVKETQSLEMFTKHTFLFLFTIILLRWLKKTI